MAEASLGAEFQVAFNKLYALGADEHPVIGAIPPLSDQFSTSTARYDITCERPPTIREVLMFDEESRDRLVATVTTLTLLADGEVAAEYGELGDWLDPVEMTGLTYERVLRETHVRALGGAATVMGNVGDNLRNLTVVPN